MWTLRQEIARLQFLELKVNIPGIDQRVLSVAILICEFIEIPTPPPITAPTQKATSKG